MQCHADWLTVVRLITTYWLSILHLILYICTCRSYVIFPHAHIIIYTIVTAMVIRLIKVCVSIWSRKINRCFTTIISAYDVVVSMLSFTDQFVSAGFKSTFFYKAKLKKNFVKYMYTSWFSIWNHKVFKKKATMDLVGLLVWNVWVTLADQILEQVLKGFYSVILYGSGEHF